VITVSEAARRAAKDPETIRRWIRSGRLPARKVGTQHIIEEADLDNLLQENEVIGVPSAWMTTWTDEPMPNWVAVVRQDRAEH
jgi:excisionase family DNA binding protein